MSSFTGNDETGECSLVNCALPQCRGKCSSINWFGNLSPCTVTLQFQNTLNGLWHSLGEFPPNVHTELGAGVILLPNEVNLRVIKTLKNKDDKPEIVLNYGRLNNDVSSIFISSDMCKELESETEQPVLLTTSTDSTSFWKKYQGWIIISVLLILGFVLFKQKHLWGL